MTKDQELQQVESLIYDMLVNKVYTKSEMKQLTLKRDLLAKQIARDALKESVPIEEQLSIIKQNYKAKSATLTAIGEKLEKFKRWRATCKESELWFIVMMIKALEREQRAIIKQRNSLRIKYSFVESQMNGEPEPNTNYYNLDEIKTVPCQAFLPPPARTTNLHVLYNCPLGTHTDSSPSFVLYDDNHYRCYGCNKWGSVIDLVMELNGVEFNEACRIIKDTI